MKLDQETTLYIVAAATVLMLPWGIFLNSPSEDTFLSKAYSFIRRQPLVWAAIQLAIGYNAIHNPAVAIVLLQMLLMVILGAQ